jgi:sulfotransferase family protein
LPAELQSSKPIFIVGAPRSGTTLLRNMLNRHHAIAVCRETEYFHLVYRRRRAFGRLTDLRNRQRLVTEYLATQRIRRMRLDFEALAEALLQDGASYEAFFLALLGFYARAHGKRRSGEKTPHHALFTETLCDWYPGATIIHLLRDPRDAVASLLRMPSSPNEALGSAYLWLRYNLGAWRSRRRPQYLPVRYEQLVTQPEQELARICAFIDEEYSRAMLVPNWDPTADRPWFRRAEEAVTTERIGKWRVLLTSEQVALIEWVVGPHMQTFGYEATGAAPKHSAIVRGLALAGLDAVRRRIGEFPGIWYSATRSPKLTKEETAKNRFRSRWLAESTDAW